MKIVTNSEFAELTAKAKKTPNRVKSMAKARFEHDPKGDLLEGDLDKFIALCACSGDKESVRWLKSVKVFSTNGMIKRIKTGQTTWNDHVLDVHRRSAQKEIPFDLNDTVVLKDSGRRGIVCDYCPDSKEYVVVFNPFQVAHYKTEDLTKVARKE